MRLAVIAIIVAAIFDALYVVWRAGWGHEPFGAELDSLSDFLCFGVAPALVLYLASLTQVGALGGVPPSCSRSARALRPGPLQHRAGVGYPPRSGPGPSSPACRLRPGALLALMPSC